MSSMSKLDTMLTVDIDIPSVITMPNAEKGKASEGTEKSREEVLAEREAAKEAKRAAKAAKAAKAGAKKEGGATAGEPSSGRGTGAADGTGRVRGGGAGGGDSSAARSAVASASVVVAARPQNQGNGGVAGNPSTGGGQDRAAANSSSSPAARQGAFTHSGSFPASSARVAATATVGTPAKPSVLGGIALFGNVSVAKSSAEMRQYIVSASQRGTIHPSVLKVAQHLASFSIVGADARAIAVLKALRDFISDYRTPIGAVLHRDLVTKLGPQIGFLVNARPLGASVGHAIRYLKYEISVTSVDLDDVEAKQHIVSRIDHFVRDRITYATRVIAWNMATGKLKQGAIILTFGKSSVVQHALLEAWQRGTRFHVIIVDARPLCEGRKMLNTLMSAGIPCTYGLLTSLSTLISRASLVLLGTASLLANGALYARAGTAPCAMMAKAKGVPVIVCCETYKFSERVQLDGFVVNEAGDPTAILKSDQGQGDADVRSLLADDENEGPAKNMITQSQWERQDALGAVNLLYDLTPPRYITAVASEVGLSGPESVGVILRDYKSVLYGQ